MARATQARLFLALALACGMALCLWLVPARQLLMSVLVWIQAQGVWGPVLLVLVYVAACVFMIPGSLLTLGAGFVFGIGPGFLAVVLGSNLGAAAAFVTGRTLLRGWVERRLAGTPRFRALDRAVGEAGFKLVLLLRLSPVVPFNVINYMLSLTGIPLRAYVPASVLGMLPGTAVYVYLGSAARSLTDLGEPSTEGQTARTILFYGGLLLTIAATTIVTRLARQTLRATLPSAEEKA